MGDSISYPGDPSKNGTGKHKKSTVRKDRLRILTGRGWQVRGGDGGGNRVKKQRNAFWGETVSPQ